MAKPQEGMEKGMEVDIEKGIEKEETRKSLAFARKMLLAGLPDSQVISFTGLTQEQIGSLKR